ncbi:hypothetical protein TWF225_003676 [Orbilia oligospora]|nr:hypothetical protein TWF225_003676 [Orbilia oligospora]
MESASQLEVDLLARAAEGSKSSAENETIILVTGRQVQGKASSEVQRIVLCLEAVYMEFKVLFFLLT